MTEIRNKAKAVLLELSGRNRNGNPKILKQSTIDEYTAINTRLFKFCGTADWHNRLVEYFDPAKINGRVSVSNWRKERAAAMHSLADAITELLDREEDEAAVPLIAHTDSLSRLMQLETPEKSIRKPKHSKRIDAGRLHKIDPQWRMKIISRMPNYRIPLLVMALSGCRPAELLSGVITELGDGVIRFKIIGAKVTDYSGQFERTLEVPIRGELAEMLAKELALNSEINPVTIKSKVNLTTAIRSAAKRAYPELKGTITAYCFRHQVAADWKSQSDGSMESNIKISKALGHQADHTKQYYGYYQQGSGDDQCLKKVEATSDVRVKNKLESVLSKNKPKRSIF